MRLCTGRIISYALAILWALAGIAKLVSIFLPSPNQSPVPPTPAQTCGCLGDLALLDADAMLSHIILLMGFHTLGFAILTTPQIYTHVDRTKLHETIRTLHPRG